MKFSMGSWVFTFGPWADHPVPFDRIVRHLSESGYDGIEICGYPPHVTLAAYESRAARRELVQFLRANNMEVSGYAPDLSSVNPITASHRDEYLELFRRNVDLCVDIGSPVIRVDTVGAPGSIEERDYGSAFDRLAAVWHDAAEIAYEKHVHVVWEFEPGFAFNKPSEILQMHQRVNHPNFSLLFDTSHAYMCAVVGARQHGKREKLAGGLTEFLKQLQGRIGAVHVIDADGTLYGDETSTHRPFGKGIIDFAALTPKLLSIPVEWWCVDPTFLPEAWELAAPSLTYVKELIAHAETPQPAARV